MYEIMVENGEIAAVIVNNDSEATLKRLYYYHEKSLLILKAENPAYEDLIFQGEELNQVHILGKAIAFQSDRILSQLIFQTAALPDCIFLRIHKKYNLLFSG